MADSSTRVFDAFSESAKALTELMLGEVGTDHLVEQMTDYFSLLEENSRLQAEVASLKENLPFKSKYENLQNEFRKVAAERDSLRAQELDYTRLKNDYERVKSAYQQTKGQLAAREKEIEEGKSSVSAYSALESLYQTFKNTCDQAHIDIRRKPMKVFIQFNLDGTNQCSTWKFRRTSATDWKPLK